MCYNALQEYNRPIAYHGESEDLKIETGLTGKGDIKRDKGVYVGVLEEENDQVDTKDEELEDIWKEMSMAMECSKV